MAKIQLERQSSRPNRFGSFAYKITDKEQFEKLQEEAGQTISGIVEGEDGDLLYFSRVRLGQLGKPVTVEVRVTKARTGQGSGNWYMNVVNTADEKLAEDMYKVSEKVRLAKSFGLALSEHATDKLILGAIGIKEQAPTPATPVTADAEPVAGFAAGQ